MSEEKKTDEGFVAEPGGRIVCENVTVVNDEPPAHWLMPGYIEKAPVQPERHSIEGTVFFMRTESAKQACICCPAGGGHIFGRGVNWDAWQTNYPEHFGNGPNVLMYKLTDRNHNEGKRVRVTVEVLPQDVAIGDGSGVALPECSNVAKVGAPVASWRADIQKVIDSLDPDDWCGDESMIQALNRAIVTISQGNGDAA